MMVQNAITPIVFRFATTQAAGDNRYSTFVALMFTELLKLFLSFGLIVVEESFSLLAAAKVVNAEILQKPRDTLALAVPAVLYALQNACLQWSTANLPAALFQVTYQGKILMTAGFSILLLNKTLLRVQWFAIFLMGLGIVVVQLANATEKKQSSMGNAAEQSLPLGLCFVSIACCCSGFASVYFEKIVKQGGVNRQPNGAAPKKKASVWVQNAQLAGFTVVLTAAAGISETLQQLSKPGLGAQEQQPVHGLFHGFTPMVWIMVVNNAVGGLIVALVIKYADNILRGFATALATILAAVAAVFCFGFVLHFSFGLGTLIVLASTLLYGGVLKLPGDWWNKESELCTALRKQYANGNHSPLTSKTIELADVGKAPSGKSSPVSESPSAAPAVGKREVVTPVTHRFELPETPGEPVPEEPDSPSAKRLKTEK